MLAGGGGVMRASEVGLMGGSAWTLLDAFHLWKVIGGSGNVGRVVPAGRAIVFELHFCLICLMI